MVLRVKNLIIVHIFGCRLIERLIEVNDERVGGGT